ncbi:MAG: helix-turn-helix transcriptional regulator [Actinomycetaceae bacterium]|nr:helix-turn-helix transcriptional regulator [Actinomycetaceae bacterium]
MKYHQARTIDSYTAQTYGRRLGEFLRQRREELGLSQEDVALRAGMDRRHYQELEHGFSNSRTRSPANPRLLTLVNLAAALEMDIEEFLGRLGTAFSDVS